MVIRYIRHESIYISLNDVTDLLQEEGLLTARQSQLFRASCKAYVNRVQARACTNGRVCDASQPVILPRSDYFFPCSGWSNLLLLPKAAIRHRISCVGYLLSEPDSIYRHPALFTVVDPMGVLRASQNIHSLTGPLVLAKRDN